MISFTTDEMFSVLEAIRVYKKNYVTNGVIEKNLNEVERKIQEQLRNSK